MLRLLTGLAASIVMVGPTVAEPLSGYQWNKRPLLVFAPSDSSPELRRQMESLRAAIAGLRERDMAVLSVVGEAGEPAMLIGSAPAADNAALRAAYSIDSDAFAVVLVGKDGGRKDRWSDPVEPGRVFSRIDSMPMRKREMREGS